MLIGAVEMGADLVGAMEDYLLVYGPEGGLVDQVGEESLPMVPLEAVGRDGSGAVVVRGNGMQWRIAADLLSHEDAGSEPVQWSVVAALPVDAQVVLEERLAAQAGISRYRVWLDLHSGNLLGPVGRWVVDLSGIAIVVLTVMGFRLVFRKAR